MGKIKTILLRILHPGPVCVIFLTMVSAAALVYVFINDLDTSFVGYAVYVLSAYTMTILALVIPGAVKKVKSLLYGNPYSNRYLTDIPFRAQVSLYAALLVNVIYAVFQLFTGIFYTSFWYSAVAVYYIVICGVRFLLLYHFRRNDDDPIRELKAYRFCGGLLFVLNIAISGMVVQMVRDGEGSRYPGLLIYLIASYAFYRITISVINMVKYRKLRSPILSASKALNFATALMAIFSLETAMLAEFGGEDNFERIINTVTGISVCLIIFGMAIYMITHANKELEKLRINITQT